MVERPETDVSKRCLLVPLEQLCLGTSSDSQQVTHRLWRGGEDNLSLVFPLRSPRGASHRVGKYESPAGGVLITPGRSVDRAEVGPGLRAWGAVTDQG
jgi:hypothetical protein